MSLRDLEIALRHAIESMESAADNVNEAIDSTPDTEPYIKWLRETIDTPVMRHRIKSNDLSHKEAFELLKLILDELNTH